MIKGILKKFEPLETGEITVTIKIAGEQLQDVVNLYRQDVVLLPQKDLIALPEEGAAPEIDERLILLRELMTDVGRIYRRLVDLNYPKTPDLEPLPTPMAAIERELTSEVLLAASMYVPPGPYERKPLTAADEFDRKDHIEFSKGIPENDFYGEKE